MTKSRCQYHGCKRSASYYMSWKEPDGKRFGYVCASHDRMLGRKNLVNAGMTVDEAIDFDIDFCKEKVDE